MRTLLSKTHMRFLACTVVVFVLTTPLFYLITRHFYAEDMIDIIEAVEQGRGIPALDLEQDIMAGVMIQFLLIFLAISLSLYITIHFVTRRLWYPFDDTLRKTEQFNLAQGDIPDFTQTDVCEFNRLNHSLTKLMEKDREMFRIQKEFSENASHELQTPLAVMCSKLDLLMQEEMNERQMQLVADLYQLTTRMSYLNRNLLLLAKIDNAQYSLQEEVDIASLVSCSLPIYSVFQKRNSIQVEDCRTNRSTRLRANPVLLECLLKNLIVNAIRHSSSGSGVQIYIEDYSLTVSNLSIDGVALDTTTLFRRFHSGDVKKGGNGLGLAIVKAICEFHGWTIHYQFEDARHCFTVSFPSTY